MTRIIVKLLAIFVCSFNLFSYSPISADDDIKVVDFTYIYETRCPYCAEFLKNQLYPSYVEGLSDSLNLTLVTLTQPNLDTKTVTCQHGENECFISKAQVCSLVDPTISQSTRIQFTYCTEEKVFNSQDVTEDDIKQCLTELLPAVSWDNVKTCIDGEESFDLLYDNYKQAASYGLSYVPFLVFFGKHDPDLENKARADFFGTVCDLLTTKPKVCLNQTMTNLIY